jgi:hypothetical protein
MIQNRYQGEISLYRETGFGSEKPRELEDMLCAAIILVRNALMYRIALNSAHCDPTTGLNNRGLWRNYYPAKSS